MTTRKEKGKPAGSDHGPTYEAALDYFDWELSERLAKDYVQVTLIFDRADELLNLKKEGLANIPTGSLNKFEKLDTSKLQAVFDAPPGK